jgi:hypothetical protein
MVPPRAPSFTDASRKCVRASRRAKPGSGDEVENEPLTELRQLDAIGVDETNAEDAVILYPVFAMEVMKRANVVD